MAQSVLFMGTESEAPVSSTVANAFNNNGGSEWCDRAYSARKASPGGMAAGTCRTGVLGSIAEAWFQYRVAGSISSDGANGKILWQARNAAGQAVVRLRWSTGGVRTFEYWNGATYTSIGTLTNATNSPGRRFTFHVKIDNTVGRFAVYVDNVLQHELLGDTDVFASSNINDFEWTGSGQFNATQYSEAVVTTEDPRKGRVYTLVPTGAGATQALTGSFADIDEIATSTATIDGDDINASSAGQVSTFTVADLASIQFTDRTILAAAVAVRARNNGGGGDVELVCRSGGTDYFGTHSNTIASAYGNGFYYVWNLNPDGAVAWTRSSINNAEWGVRAITAGSVDVSKMCVYVYSESTTVDVWDAAYPVDMGMENVTVTITTSLNGGGMIDIVSPTLEALDAFPKLVHLRYGPTVANAAQGNARMSQAVVNNMIRADQRVTLCLLTSDEDNQGTTNTDVASHATLLGNSRGGGSNNVRIIGQPVNDTTWHCEFMEWIAGGIRIYCNTVGADVEVNATVFWGSDLDIVQGNTALGTGTSAIATTGLGFQPDALFVFYHAGVNTNVSEMGLSYGAGADDGGGLQQRCIQRQSVNGVAAGGAPYQQYDNTHIAGRINTGGTQQWLLTLNSLDADGFTVTPSASAGSTTIWWIAMRSQSGLKFKVMDLVTPTSTGSASITGVGFEPQFGLGAVCSVQTANTIEADNEPASAISIFSIDPDLNQDTIAESTNSTADPTDTNVYNDRVNAVRIGTNSSTVAEVVAEATAWAADGVTFNYTVASATSKLGFVLLIEGDGGPPLPPSGIGQTLGLLFVTM